MATCSWQKGHEETEKTFPHSEESNVSLSYIWFMLSLDEVLFMMGYQGNQVYHRLLQEHMYFFYLTPSDPVSIEMDLFKTRVTKNEFFPLCFYVVEESEPV